MKMKSAARLTVDELNFHVQGLILSDAELGSVLVSGEIAEFKRHTSGHCYFTLLGTETRLSCALFKSDAAALPRWPRNGDGVLVSGRVGVFPQRGVYQLYARRIIPAGEGAIERARQELKGRLEAEGLFRPEIKRPIPRYPVHAAVITSAAGAAVRDVLRIASRRYPLCSITVIPALVQGVDAPDSIVRAFAAAAALPGPVDCVLLVRGGGSREDLVPFDDERVVRAVRNCPWPVVSGVGHEIDETLCDLAADLRASTPSAAAELVFPDRAVLLARLEKARHDLCGSVTRRITDTRKELHAAFNELQKNAERRITDERGRLSDAMKALVLGTRRSLEEARGRLAVRTASLNALSPLGTLARGYAAVEKEGRRLVSVRELTPGENITVSFSDGQTECLVRSRNYF